LVFVLVAGADWGAAATRETAEELNELQALLDASLSRSTTHLRSIITERTLTLTASRAAARGAA
jgi:hypothetical protein